MDTTDQAGEIWTTETAKALRQTAVNCLNDHSCGSNPRALELDNCGAHSLNGRKATEDGPNYAGWARVLVEAGRPIPALWTDAFQRERDSDNRQYAQALERSIATFGLRFTT